MKRLLILLVLVAGGLAWAAFAVPTNAAVVNGVGISQHLLDSDVTAIADSPYYQCYLNAQEYLESNAEGLLPLVAGVGFGSTDGLHPTATTAFVASYLDTAVGHQLVLELAAKRHVTVTAGEIASARAALIDQITSTMTEVLQTAEADDPRLSCGSSRALTGQDVLATMPASFVSRQVQFDATISSFEENLSGVGSTPADLERYLNQHQSVFDTSCISLAVYTTASDAQAAAAKVKSGTPFATVASQATQGGPQGCIVLYDISADLPASADLASLPLNTVSAPISYSGQYLLLEITKRTPTPFTSAEAAVQHAVQALGSTKSQQVIDDAERTASVQIDPRYGKWVITAAQIETPSPPASLNVLDPSVNSPAVASASSSPFGASTSSTGQSG